MGKGSGRRKQQITSDKMQENWERIFGTKTELQTERGISGRVVHSEPSGETDSSDKREADQAE